MYSILKGYGMHMQVIGVLAPQHSSPIIRLLKRILRASKKRCMIFKSDNPQCKYISQLKNTDIDFAVVDIDGEIAGEIFFDLIILDNTAGKADKEKYFLEKCITATTKIIYNIDVECMSLNPRCSRIGYGLSAKADVTASSVVRHDIGVELVYCIQKNIPTVHGELIEMSEQVIKLEDETVNIYHALAAVTCALVCGG